MNHTSVPHAGLLVTGTGDDLEVDLEVVGGRTLRMSAAGDELGAWPVDECHIEPDPSRAGSFRLVVDGEAAVFTPEDPERFSLLVATLTGTAPPTSSDDEPAAAAADDPVAFLFGSAPPPTPASTDLPDFDSIPEEPSDVWDEVAADHRDTDERVGPDVVEDEVQLEVSDDEETVLYLDDEPAVLTDEPVGEFAQPEPKEEISQPEPVGQFGDEDPSAELDVPGAESDDVSRASTLDHLSAVIGTLRTAESEPDLPTDEDEDEEYVLGPNTVAAEVLETQRSLREHRMKEISKGKWLKWIGVVAGTGALVALFSFLTPRAIDFLQTNSNDESGSVTTATAEPTVPSTSVTTVPAETTETTAPEAVPVLSDGSETIFDRPSPEFVAAWDAAGGSIDEVLLFDGLPQLGPFEERFTPFLTMEGVVQPDGTLDEFRLVIDPTGPAEYDRIGIQALGVAIATVDPERSPQGRATLLGELGLNVRQPLLEGIDGATEAAGIAYTLVYDAAANLLVMTVAPAD